MAVAFGAIGAKSAGGTATITVAHPASVGAGDLLVAGRCVYHAADIAATAEAGWTAGGKLRGGTGNTADAHTSLAAIDYKEAAGGETGSVTFDQGGTVSGALGVMARYTKTSGSWAVAAATGDDATHGADRSVTASSSLALAPGDWLVAVVAVDTDPALTITSPTFTATGITFGTVNRRTSGAGVITGTDGNIELFDVAVTAGTATVAPTFAFTTATTQCGPVSFLRIRAATTTVSGQAAASLGGTFTAAGVDRALGAASASLTFTAAASGVAGAPTVTGAASAALGGTFAAAGVPRTPGAASAALGFTAAAAGVDRALGAALAALGFTGAVSGLPRVLGAAAAVLTFTGSGAGVDRTLGAASASLGFTGTASGVIGGPPVTGVASAAIGFAGAAAGTPRVIGSAAAAFSVSAAATGVPRVTGAAVALFAVTGGAAGRVRVVGAVATVVAFSAAAAGTNLPDLGPTRIYRGRLTALAGHGDLAGTTTGTGRLAGILAATGELIDVSAGELVAEPTTGGSTP